MAHAYNLKPIEPAGSVVPAARPRAPRKLPWLFALVVALPTLLAVAYFGFIAAPIYVSEARFIVRAPGEERPSLGLGSMLQGVGLTRTEADAFAVHQYIMSRDAVADLNKAAGLRAALDRPGIDAWSRFPRPFEKASAEQLFKAYPRFVSVGYDTTTGISNLEVRAFRPQDARAIADALLTGGEAMINRLNAQAERDAVQGATSRVLEDRIRLQEIQASMTRFRNRERVIDPARSSAANLELIGRLSTELATLRAERSGLAAAAAQSPQLPGLDSRILAYERQIENERAKMAGETDSLAPKISEYEKIVLERELGEKELTAAVAALESARLDASRKRLYLQRVVNPSQPDAPVLPRRLRGILLVFVSALVAFGSLSLLLAGLREHQQ